MKNWRNPELVPISDSPFSPQQPYFGILLAEHLNSRFTQENPSFKHGKYVIQLMVRQDPPTVIDLPFRHSFKPDQDLTLRAAFPWWSGDACAVKFDLVLCRHPDEVELKNVVKANIDVLSNEETRAALVAMLKNAPAPTVLLNEPRTAAAAAPSQQQAPAAAATAPLPAPEFFGPPDMSRLMHLASEFKEKVKARGDGDQQQMRELLRLTQHLVEFVSHGGGGGPQQLRPQERANLDVLLPQFLRHFNRALAANAFFKRLPGILEGVGRGVKAQAAAGAGAPITREPAPAPAPAPAVLAVDPTVETPAKRAKRRIEGNATAKYEVEDTPVLKNNPHAFL